MTGFASLKNQWHWAGLPLLSALIAAAAFVVPDRISHIELEREASVAATRLKAQILKEPDALLDALSGPALTPQFAALFDKSGYGHRVLRYEFYDKDGRLAFTSGLAGLRLSDEIAQPPVATTNDAPRVFVYEGTGSSSTSHFAALALPLSLNAGERGTLVVYLDQSDRAGALSNYFGLVAGIMLLLLSIGITTAVAIAWMRAKERRRAEEQVHYLENHDPLTGLHNRRAFGEMLGGAMERTLREGTPIAVIFLDIDKFKEINDAAEHGGGDAVLREVGARIQSSLRDGDLIARLGADEFAIALLDIINLGDVMAFMNRLIDALRPPVYVGGKEILCTTSVGIALAPGDGDNASTILRHVAIALARAKGDGGQRMCFFEQSMDKALQRRRMVEHELRLALGREEFEVVYQPQYDLATERQCGSEALIRWHHPVHGKIAPGHFISVAEDTGLIVPIGEWVLKRACGEATSWDEPLMVAVNLSPAQFRDGDIAETVASVLKETGLAPERLEIEITENLLINDTEEVLGKLNRLRELGVAIAMDDFGTGYSSLSYLARFPFSKIKIDRQFIRNMTRDSAMRAIVKTIVALGKSLEIAVTAEGVETQEQDAMLREFGCPQVQGFLYGYPEAADAGARTKGKVTPTRAARSSAA
jgi:diguanylate cyclase (GGDEF)-like protein